MTSTLGSLQREEKRSRERLEALHKKMLDPSLSPGQKKALMKALPHQKKALEHAKRAVKLRQQNPL